VTDEAPRLDLIANTEAGGDFNKPLEAQKELAKRELSRRRLLPFTERFQPDYEAGWIHIDLCERLERFAAAVARKEHPRLMISVPPRHGKSTIASRMFPAWYLGHFPTHEFILCSYSGSLAMSFSRQVRAIMRDSSYHQLFKTGLDPDSQSVENWLTTAGGGLLASGVSGAQTGKGAHVLLIDDPVKNREDADSEMQRQSCYDWYTSTAYTRLAPGGGVLVIQTRWHDDDLSGRLLEAQLHGGDDWEVVTYEAVASADETHRKKGEALHPARYDISQLKRIRAAIGERDWSALYQQKPVSDEGGYFNSTMFPRYGPAETPPRDEMTTYTAWDLAIGLKEENDYTVGVTVGMDKQSRLWVLDVVRGKWDGYALVQQILDNFTLWRPDRVGIEKGQIQMSINVFLQKEIEHRQLWDCFVDPLVCGRNDKQARQRGIQSMMKAQQVLWPNAGSTHWVDQAIFEMMRFPSGVHDDVCDAFGHVGLMVGSMNTVPEERAKPRKSWKDKLNKYVIQDSTRRGWRQA
jgi:predicted phage terminase large subunit-like protein